MSFFYEASTLDVFTYTAVLLYIFALVGLNEVARKNLVTGIFMYVALPLFLIVFVWPNTMDETVSDWFTIAKLIAILAFAWIILALRFSKKVQNIPWFKYLVPTLLIINILEAVSKDFVVSTYQPGVYDGIYTVGGLWNVANATAGLLNIVVITGFVGIYISRDKNKTMVWPDMLVWWIIAYDLWNYAFMYNNGGGRSFFMLSSLLAASVATHFFRRGAWMQHRVFILAINQMILITIPTVFVSSSIAVESTFNPAANWTLSLLALGSNIALLIYQIRYMKINKRNSIKGEVYFDTKEYLETVNEEKIHEAVEKMN